MKVELPYNFTPRSYQMGLWNYMCEQPNVPGLRAVFVAHRRAGKDKEFINIVVTKMQERVGTYYYMFPTYKQGRQILWEGIDKDGFKFMDHFPKELVKRRNDTTMLLELYGGQKFQIIGTDNYNHIVGTNPVGMAFSEYSLQDPMAWNIMRPILAENGGWAMFNMTPRGKNHGWDILQMAKQQGWYNEVLDVDKTGVIPRDVLDREREEMRRSTGSDSLFRQEYYCDFTVPIQGAYYEEQINHAYDTGRVGLVPYERAIPVNTVWDLGVGDSTAIWFYQLIGSEVRVINYYENHGKGLDYYAKVLQDKGYVYGEHYAPHDIRVKELGSGKTRLEIARELGIHFRLVPSVSIADGITSARLLFDRCWFDEKNCEQGLSALKFYHKEFDEKNRVYNDRPAHDWSSHASDGFRYLALSVGAVVGGYYDGSSSDGVIDTSEEDPYE